VKIIKIYDKKSCLNPFMHGLNVRKLLNPIFFGRVCRHMDMKRQRSRRQRSKDLAQARRLKTSYVPLWSVSLPDIPDGIYRADITKKLSFPYRYGPEALIESLSAYKDAEWRPL
jgi:hypothetical protein